jgi:hypothetical protein
VRPEIVEEVGERYAIVTFHRHLHHVIHAVLRIRDVYPGSWILFFVHPGSRIQKEQLKRGVKKISCPTFSFVATNITKKIENYLIFELVKKKI